MSNIVLRFHLLTRLSEKLKRPASKNFKTEIFLALPTAKEIKKNIWRNKWRQQERRFFIYH